MKRSHPYHVAQILAGMAIKGKLKGLLCNGPVKIQNQEPRQKFNGKGLRPRADAFQGPIFARRLQIVQTNTREGG